MSSKPSAWTVVAAIACALGVARAARAQSAGDLELHVAPDARGCVTESSLRARIASLQAQAEGARGLAFALDASSDSPLLEVRREGALIAARRFDALPERCADRLQTIALVITLAIEHALPSEGESSDERAQEPVVTPEAAPPQPAPAVRAPDTAPKTSASGEGERDDASTERAQPSVRMVVGAGAAYGLLPELTGTLAAGVELPGSGLWLGLAALVSSQASTELAEGTALTRLAGARAYGCASRGQALELQACAGATLAVVSGSGRGYAPSADATATLLSPLLRLGARYPADGFWAIGFAIEGFVHLVRPELQVSGNAGAVATLPPLGAVLSIEGVLAVP